MKLRLRHFLKFTSLLLYLFVLSCEDVELALPGNTQDLKASPPKGSMAWSVTTTKIDDNVVGQLPEDLQGTNTVLGIIGIDDDNPDDEIDTVIIQSQTIPNLFSVMKDSLGNWKVVLKSSAIIDYETLHSQNASSTLSKIIMEITDDSPTGEKGTLSASVEITNVNENPTWDNTNVYTGIADVGLPYESSEINWGDTDLVDDHILTSDDRPGWLTIEVNKLTGMPLAGDINPSTSFTLKLTDDGGLSITNDFTINVRDNDAPYFTSATSVEWDELIEESWTISFSDPNSYDRDHLTAVAASNSYGLEFVQNGLTSGVVTGAISHTYAGQNLNFDITLSDNRAEKPAAVTQEFIIFVVPNEAPYFTISTSDTWEEERNDSWTISFTDPNSVDQSSLTADVSDDVESALGDYGLEFNQISGTYGNITGTIPTAYVGQTLIFDITVTDDRAGNILSTTETFQLFIDANDAPNFSNETSIPQSINHGCPYYFDVSWSDPDGDNVVLTWENNVTWLNINSNGLLSGTPLEGDINSSGTVSLTITDNRPNVPLSTDYSFSINVGENFAPVFTNSESVDTTATVGEEYSFEFAINDENSDALTFTVPTRPSWLTYDASLYKVYGTPPDTTHIGPNDVTVKAEDCGTSTSFDFSIEVSE
jgi:hypothetical protein